MKSIIRKNDPLPAHLDPERFEAIFWRMSEHPEKPQSKRVEEVLDLIANLRDDVSTLEKAQALARLRRVLHLYQWVSQVSYAAGGFHVIHVIANRGKLSEDDAWEYEAIRDLLDLVPYLGKGPRIRKCAECKEWFFAAKREDQQFCKRGACRQRRYDSDPVRREEKKKYMRKYRKLTSSRSFR